MKTYYWSQRRYKLLQQELWCRQAAEWKGLDLLHQSPQMFLNTILKAVSP